MNRLPSEYIDDFQQYLMHVKKYSKHTCTNYHIDLRQFFRYLEDFGEMTVTEVTHSHIRSWMVALMSDNISSKSINRKLSSLRSFYKYLMRQAIVDRNPTQKVIAPKIPKRLPSYVDTDKMHNILDDRLLGSPNYAGAREYITISLLYHTGIRRSELLGLRLNDIDEKAGTIKVLGKGNKERLIPLSNQALEDIAKYVEVRAEQNSITDHFILTDKGKPPYPKLIYNIVTAVLKKYNASEKVSPHVLRHTFATHLTSSGADINAVKELLGHSSLAATQVYTHNNIERLKAVYDQSHPKSKS